MGSLYKSSLCFGLMDLLRLSPLFDGLSLPQIVRFVNSVFYFRLIVRMIDKLGCSTNIAGFQLPVFMRMFLLYIPNITPPGSATYCVFNDSSPGCWQSNDSIVGFPFEIQLLLGVFLEKGQGHPP